MHVITSINGLLRTLSAVEGPTTEDTRAIATGLPAIDALLPGGAFASGAVHEILSGTDTPSFLLPILVVRSAARSFAPLLARRALDSAESVLNTNLMAPLRLSVGLGQMLWRFTPEENKRLNRNIINISNSAGLFVYPDRGQGLYAVSKAALNHLTYHLASELWTIAIRANAIAPDSSPDRIPTQQVLDAIIDFDASERTGEVLPLLPQKAPQKK